MADEVETSALDDVRAAAAELARGADNGAGDREPAGADGAAESGESDRAEAPAGRARDEAGRFAKADGQPATITEKDLTEKPGASSPLEKPDASSPSAAAPPAPNAADDKIPPPAEWRGAGKVKWGLLPKEVQAELRDTYASVQATQAEIGPLKEIIDYARPMLVREAGSVGEGIRQLVAFHELSLTKPLELIHHIARTRGIDLSAAFGGQPQPGTTQQGQPDIQAIIAQTVQQHLQPFQAQIEQRENQSTIQTVEAFRADPAHPYFEDVRPFMAALLKSGQAKDLQDAYDKATWADPSIRTALQQRQSEEAANNRKAEVEKARRASAASLTGSPLPNGSSMAAANPSASVLDDVRAAARALAEG